MNKTVEKQLNDHRLLKILSSLMISEKAMRLSEKNNHLCFCLAPDANKLEVKQAVEFLFGAKVASVRILNRKGKEKRFRGRVGSRKDKKIAYVALSKDSKVAFDEGVLQHARH